MGRKRYTPEQIVHLLREAEILLSQGRTVPKMCRELGLAEQAYYRWRRTYPVMSQSCWYQKPISLMFDGPLATPIHGCPTVRTTVLPAPVMSPLRRRPHPGI